MSTATDAQRRNHQAKKRKHVGDTPMRANRGLVKFIDDLARHHKRQNSSAFHCLATVDRLFQKALLGAMITPPDLEWQGHGIIILQHFRPGSHDFEHLDPVSYPRLPDSADPSAIGSRWHFTWSPPIEPAFSGSVTEVSDSADQAYAGDQNAVDLLHGLTATVAIGWNLTKGLRGEGPERRLSWRLSRGAGRRPLGEWK